jgi:hypothetical protein
VPRNPPLLIHVTVGSYFKTAMKQLLVTSVISMMILFIVSCRTDRKKSDSLSIDITFINGLIEKQISDSNYCISIPKNYTIEETEGPDFLVYYFFQTDTTTKPTFYGGLYFGNHPNMFESNNDSCKKETIKSKILDNNADWITYNCNEEYSIQTIIESKSGQDWNEYIHAFGGATSKVELTKVFNIFKTLKKK